MGDLLKIFSDHSPRIIQVHLPHLADYPPTNWEKARDKFLPSQQVQTCYHYSGTNFPLEGEGGKEDRIIYQRSKQEKAYLTSLESQRRLPTVGGKGKRAALWSDVSHSYEGRTEIYLYCCLIAAPVSNNHDVVWFPVLTLTLGLTFSPGAKMS
jgi:hypothetical protein